MNTSMRHDSLDIARPLLMLGVVLIHSSLLTDIPADMSGSIAAAVMAFLSQGVSGGCVPAFFIISGYLFFQSGQFGIADYKRKLRSRFHSLAVPYLLWNAIASIIFLAKALALGYPGLGIVEDGRVNPAAFIAGFWAAADGYPYDFPMWFVRDLIVMVALSPLVWLVARRTWATLLAIAAIHLSPVDVFGTMYFLLGAWLAMHRVAISSRSLAALSVLLSASLALTFGGDSLGKLAISLSIFARNIGLAALAVLIGRLASRNKAKLPPNLQGMAFFVFAFHGMYCTLMRKSLLALTGATTAGILAAYALTFTLLVATSALAYAALARISPRVASILCGSR